MNLMSVNKNHVSCDLMIEQVYCFSVFLNKNIFISLSLSHFDPEVLAIPLASSSFHYVRNLFIFRLDPDGKKQAFGKNEFQLREFDINIIELCITYIMYFLCGGVWMWNAVQQETSLNACVFD